MELNSSKWPTSASDNVTMPESGSWERITDSQAHLIEVIVNCTFSLTVCVFGIVTNIINLCVFIKQGFTESINVSFASLTVADLLTLLFLLWRDILYIPQMEDTALPIDPMPFMYMTAGWPHVFFVRTGMWIAAFITFERCLCIVMPLKVKSLITPRRVVFIHLSIFFLIFPTIAPVYHTNRLTWLFYPEKNRSLIGLTFSDDRYEIERIILPINGTIIPVAAIVVNILCSLILIVKLNYHREWRQKQASVGNPNKNPQSGSTKEARITKMAVAISIIIVICFIPFLFIVYWMTTEPEYRLDGKLKNTFILLASLALLFEAFNCSANIFVYYSMSTKFRSTMHEMFAWKKRRRGNDKATTQK